MAADVVTPEPPAPAVAARRRPHRGRDLEPLLLAALAAAGAAGAWAADAGRGAWTATLAVAVLAGSAELARRQAPARPQGGVRTARACLTLAAAAVAVGSHPGPAPLALAWLPAVCAVYGLLLAPRAAAVLTLGALATLGVLAAAAATAGGPVPTAYVTCSLCVLVAWLAATTLRAVAEAARHVPLASAPTVDGDPSPRSAAHPSPPATDGPPPSSSPSPPPPDTGSPLLPDADRSVLLDAAARAQSRSGVVGGRVGVLVVTLRGLADLPAAVGRDATRVAVEVLTRRARAWLPAGDLPAWLPDGRLAVLLEGVDAQTCLVVGRRLAALLGEPVPAAGHVLTLPATVSVTLAGDAAEAPAALLRRAEAAPALSASELAAPAQAGVEQDDAADPLVAGLWPALTAGRVGIALQPVVALGALPRHDRVVAVEALARWTREDGLAVPPARFVAAARRAGLADLLGATVLAQALDELVARRAAGDPGLAVCVNVAPEQLTGPAVAAGMLQALDARGLEPAALTVEVPAGAPAADPDAVATLRALRDAGVAVALDNFGATGSSLVALRDLPLTAVKLDRSLVADLGADDRLVVAALRLAGRLGLRCTAVGVETPAQLDAARGLGIDAVQGHLLGRPAAPAGAASDRLADPLTASAGGVLEPA